MTGTEAPITAQPRRLPQEIWWLIIEKAAEEHECTTLFLLARLCRDMALIALPLMYGKFTDPNSPDNNLEIRKPEASALDIPNLRCLLQCLPDVPCLRQKLYSPPLDYLEKLHNIKTGDSEVVLFEVTNEMTKYIKSIADQGHGSASLTCLDSPNLNYSPSSVYFPVWASRLTGLTTLNIIEGSCLENHLTQSIVQHCPAFNQFGCEVVRAGAESKVIRFCKQLPPNTLESFSVRRAHVVEGNALFYALNKHARSLKELRLGLEEYRAYASLDRLRNCTNLKTLELARADYQHLDPDVSWASLHASVYSRIVAWLQNCSQLKELTLYCIPGGSQLLQDILKSPNVRLTDLRFKETSELETSAPWYTSLHHQQSLSYLQLDGSYLQVRRDGPINGRCEGLAEAISQLPELRGLNAKEYFSPEDIEKISGGALNLETISLEGRSERFKVCDAHLMSLAKLPRLKDLNLRLNADSTKPGLLRFIKEMKKDPNGQHDGFTFTIQKLMDGLAEDDENKLKNHIKRAFKGTFYNLSPWYS